MAEASSGDEGRVGGLIPREGRRAPGNVQAAARARGACLADHRSRTVDEALLRESDVIVLSEPRNFVELRRAFPEYLDKIVMLGARLQPPLATIKDPYQHSTAETDHIAAQVDTALAELAILLGAAPDDAVLESARHPGVPSPRWSPEH